MQQPSTSTQPTTRAKVAQFARSRTGQWIILGLCIGGFIGVIYASNSYFYGHERFADLTGCYDSSGNAYIILVRGQDVDSQGDQCKFNLSFPKILRQFKISQSHSDSFRGRLALKRPQSRTRMILLPSSPLSFVMSIPSTALLSKTHQQLLHKFQHRLES
ncbi:hypothetical protein BDR26DRAFT_27995 [Obelidium mucronatum]|nr:hypothetical protein BDR26DRAFT_27995 [Obelidium mucronatum]